MTAEESNRLCCTILSSVKGDFRWQSCSMHLSAASYKVLLKVKRQCSIQHGNKDLALSQNYLLWNKQQINESKTDLSKLNITFNHYRDIRASSKFQKIWLRRGRWRPEAHISKNVEANCQINIICINKLHIWSLHKYILVKKELHSLKTTFRDTKTVLL